MGLISSDFDEKLIFLFIILQIVEDQSWFYTIMDLIRAWALIDISGQRRRVD